MFEVKAQYVFDKSSAELAIKERSNGLSGCTTLQMQNKE
jgi:hypothetical protein